MVFMVSGSDVVHVSARILFRLIFSGIHSAVDARNILAASKERFGALTDLESAGVKTATMRERPKSTKSL